MDRWQRVEKIYRSALEVVPARRSAFLTEACEGDPGLRREVGALLNQEDSGELPTVTAFQSGVGPLADSTEFGPGSQLGPYKLENAIGAGGMGQVYRATDTRLRRSVAIKMLLGEGMADSTQRRRFLQEARAASALNHPNIVTVHDISNHAGVDYLVMEYVAGKNLKDLIRGEGMPLEEVARIGVQVASALDAAHAARIVHRDIKPANIMITPAGHVKVLDFGVAKLTAPSPAIGGETVTAFQGTIPGMIVGTIAYMSPEQTRAEQVDGRSDIFSLGCVLYEAATGRRPFHGESMLAIMHAIATAEPAAPSTLRPDLPLSFDQLIRACLAKKPEQRPAAAAEVGEALRAAATNAPTAPTVSVLRPESRSSVAVLPLQFLTAAAEDQFLSVALADALSNRLASSGKLLVRPMANVMRYAGKPTDWAQAARELNVDLVVEGTIQKMGPRIRVMVQAYRAADSVSLHSAKYDGTMDDLFGLQDRIADSVAAAFLPGETTVSQSVAPDTRNPLAFELYMRAIDRLQHTNKFDNQAAIEMLTRAVELDPEFADAWGRLAYSYAQMGQFFDPDPKWFELAERAIARTLELDPVQCEALCARGRILWSAARNFQNRAALRAIQAALKINPGFHDARHWRGVIAYHLGFYASARHDADEYLLVHPRHALAHGLRAGVLMESGDIQLADEEYVRALAIDPALVQLNIFYPLVAIWTGRLEEGRERIHRARQMIPGEPQLTAMEGLIAAREGDLKQAQALAEEALNSKKSLIHVHHMWHCVAGVFAMCGMPEKAVAQLRRCGEMGLPNYHLFDRDPHLQPLRGNPEFQALLSQLRREHDSLREEFALSD